MFFIHSSIAWTTLKSKFLILLFLNNSELPKKHARKETFFSNGRHFVKKYFFDFFKVHATAAFILIKNPFGFSASDDQKGWNHARQDTLFLDPPHCHNFVNFEFFRLIFYIILKYQ